MRIPNDLRQSAIEAFKAGGDWTRFVAEHGHEIREAEPYDASRYRALRGRLLHIVVSGDAAGQFAAGDPDAIPEWEIDDQAEPPHDTATTCLLPWPAAARSGHADHVPRHVRAVPMSGGYADRRRSDAAGPFVPVHVLRAELQGAPLCAAALEGMTKTNRQGSHRSSDHLAPNARDLCSDDDADPEYLGNRKHPKHTQFDRFRGNISPPAADGPSPPRSAFQNRSIFGASEKSNRASDDFLRRRPVNSRFAQRS